MLQQQMADAEAAVTRMAAGRGRAGSAAAAEAAMIEDDQLRVDDKHDKHPLDWLVDEKREMGQLHQQLQQLRDAEQQKLGRRKLRLEVQHVKQQLMAAVTERDAANKQLAVLAEVVRNKQGAEAAAKDAAAADQSKRAVAAAAAAVAAEPTEAEQLLAVRTGAAAAVVPAAGACRDQAGGQQAQLHALAEMQQLQLLDLARKYQRLSNRHAKLKSQVKDKKQQLQQADVLQQPLQQPQSSSVQQQPRQAGAAAQRQQHWRGGEGDLFGHSLHNAEEPFKSNEPDSEEEEEGEEVDEEQVEEAPSGTVSDGPPAPADVLQFAANFAGDEGRTRPGSAPPSSLLPLPAGAEVAVPPTVQLLASHYHGGWWWCGGTGGATWGGFPGFGVRPGRGEWVLRAG